MTPQSPRTVMQRMLEKGMREGDVDAAVAAYAPGFVYHNPIVDEMPDLPPGIEGMKLHMRGARAAFPDIRYAIESIVAEEDRVAVLYSWTGTHTGSIGRIPPTGRRVSATGAMFCCVSEARIVEQWDFDDRMSVMRLRGAGDDAAQPA